MSRKRRRSCKGSRKSSDTRENEHLPIICRCQQNTEGAENKTGEDTTNVHEPLDMEQADKNRNNHSCTLENEKNHSDGPENKEQDNIIDSEKEGKPEKDCASLTFSTQQNEAIAVVNVDELGISSTGKIALQCNSNTESSLHSDNGLITEVKCGSFTVKVEVKKTSLFDPRTDYVAGERECPKNRHYHKGHCHKWHKKPSPPTGHSGKYEALPKYTIQIANKQNPSMKVSVAGNEITVNYINGKQKLMVNIESGVEPRKCSKVRSPSNGNTFTSDTDYSATDTPCHSDFESDLSFQEKEESFTGYSCPKWYALIPPPAQFADTEDICLDSTTEVVSLSPSGDVPDTFSAILNCGEGSDVCQKEDTRRKECANGKDFYDDIIFSEFSYTGESLLEDYSSREIHFVKKPNNEMIDVLQLRNKSLVDTRNIMLISQKESKKIRRNSFPATSTDILSSFHPRRDSGFYSMPSLSLKVLPKPTKTTNIYSKGIYTPNSCTELCSSFASLFGNFRDLKSSCCYAFASYDHDMTVYHAELEENLGNAFFMDHGVEFMGNCREIGQTVVEGFYSNAECKEKHGSIESLRSLDACEEYTEFAKTEFGRKGDSDQHKVQAYLELQNEAPLSQAPSFSRSPSNVYSNYNSISTKIATECLQDQHSVIQPNTDIQQSTAETEVTKKRRRGSVMTVITGELERRLIIQGDNKAMADSFGLAMKKESILPCSLREKAFMSPLLDAEEPDLDNNEFQSFTDSPEVFESTHEVSNCQDYSVLATAASNSLEDEHILSDAFLTESQETLSSEQDIRHPDHFEIHPVAGQRQELPEPSCEKDEIPSEINMDLCQNLDTSKSPENQTGTAAEDKSVILSNEHVAEDTKGNSGSQEEATDRWARRRKQFKDSKRCSSIGGSSINSTITEGSLNSEDGRSFDLSVHGDSEERGFYTEIFHSTSWVFRGDDASPDNSPRCLSKRPRPVAVRERTVRIAKGTGDYPWGFRIQFSKPILVTEVDTNSAAEEAGLQIGDMVMAVNGTDVTSMPHSEAATLARKGPDVLTLLVGSDISRCPNTPRPTCRGYLHKRTQSGILKGWRKRWFVLKHDGCLYYYKHKKDEGKCRPLEVTKLEGAEIGADTSLGKPFVFKCVPQSGHRTFYFCATSNQEMKRWLEAMEKAVHPVHQNHVWVDVTIHNTSLPPLAIKNPECLGLLHQLDKNKDMWIQHYCILKDGCLYFYASIRSTYSLGGIYLQGYTVSEQALGSRRSVIEVKPPSEEFKTFYLCAESVNENKRWITALRTSVSKWLPLDKAIQDFMNRPLEETRM
ncbi:uncharacterized protein LOC128347416 [Hemicordylus capensis]|uniref:uncharacterized protein LOC128347416 n=1 Tax=Hemicordylus capensis TaxID=884348 RepID=UPI002303D986|nr:uncharacterized protein LOC128347416 [Hemicordylus capensis]XP_053157971.1 uncharacterized protein LOC128347416 [Hemicordylus capensis]XP_053157972.1 uncharacterized protein LOC128347416 [Hemicordylus capensis]XP_053157973.1 uncharacterized protein LOC128347416 [Hemicordylus capensis]XP_053157974.1 uncharacterized protein LOC128347416 [Hemicordylus capensis]XP_053157975.1 uncharacterized protein LOC128347416 [Hemicordylus capensis]